MATTPLPTQKKWLVALFLGLLGALWSGVMFLLGTSFGVQHGLDSYHQTCYTVGGVVERAGTFVGCLPLTSRQ